MNHLLLINFLEVVVNTFRSSEVPDLPGLQEYIADIGRRFCPFLNPASSRGLVMYSVYELNPGDLEQTQSLLFCIGLLHTEILRRTRTNVSLQQRPLVCENIFFRFPGEDSVDGSELFGWPHWLLKTRYTQVGVLFGKFWKGEESISRKESPVPPSPYHMLSIRGAVKLRDPQFFKKAPELLDTLVSAEDGGQFVFDDIGMETSMELQQVIQMQFVTTDDVLEVCYRLLGSFDLYHRLYAIEAKRSKVS